MQLYKGCSHNRYIYILVSYIRYWKSNTDSGGKMNCGTYMCVDEEHEGRRFLTAEEKIEKLEQYKKWLESEKKGVEETIARIKNAK